MHLHKYFILPKPVARGPMEGGLAFCRTRNRLYLRLLWSYVVFQPSKSFL
jgi:hypothetical protein